MAIELTKPDFVAERMLQEVMSQHHKALVHAGVTVGLLMAEKEKREGMAVPGESLTLHGYACAGIVSIVPYKWRVLGAPDAVIRLDKPAWDYYDAMERRALVDHELTHLMVRTTDGGLLTWDGDAGAWLGMVKLDLAGRPMLTMRRHDWQLGGFREVVKRYGRSALESQAARVFRDRGGQYAWEFELASDGRSEKGGGDEG